MLFRSELAYLKDIEKLTRRHIPVIENHPWPMEIFEAAPKAQRQPRPPREQRQAAAGGKGRAPARDRAAPRLAIQQPQPAEPAKPLPPRPARVIRTESRSIPGRVVAFTDGRRRGRKSR